MVNSDCLLLLLYKIGKNNLFITFRSSDGRILIASSTDGYCSIINFQKGELGEEYKKQSNTPTKHTNDNDLKESTSNFATKSEKPLPTTDIDNSAIDIDIAKTDLKENFYKNSESSLNQNNKLLNHTNQKIDLNNKMDIEETEDIKLVYNEESTNGISKTITEHIPEKLEIPLIIPNKTPRRVQLITLSSPKGLKKE